jgi:hypothetical protein
MVILIGYLLAAIVVGFILTMGVSLFHPMKKLDDFKPLRWVIAMAVVAGAAPYGWIEYVTRQNQAELKPVVEYAVKVRKVRGPLLYWKVLYKNESRARVVAVAQEKSLFGNPERTVMSMDVEKVKKGWRTTDFEFVNSFSRSLDYSTFPPYF